MARHTQAEHKVSSMTFERLWSAVTVDTVSVARKTPAVSNVSLLKFHLLLNLSLNNKVLEKFRL